LLLKEGQVISVLRAGSVLISDLGDAIEHDPEVRLARRIADAARTRLVACVTGSSDGIDPAQAQRMLDAFRTAMAHAEEAEDQVLVHRGLLTSAEADRRAAHRRPAASRAGKPAEAVRGVRVVRRGRPVRGLASALALAAAGVAGVVFARWLGVRPPLMRW
jgi:hypothetical protein